MDVGFGVVIGTLLRWVYEVAGLEFDITDPLKCLEAITAAWTTIFATASAWYPLTKKREKKE